jgi:hypothetical protein
VTPSDKKLNYTSIKYLERDDLSYSSILCSVIVTISK